jgi:hypothetical protein
MSPRLSASVKRIVPKKHADFDPFLFGVSIAPAPFLLRRTHSRRQRWRSRDRARSGEAREPPFAFAVIAWRARPTFLAKLPTVKRKKLNEGASAM